MTFQVYISIEGSPESVQTFEVPPRIADQILEIDQNGGQIFRSVEQTWHVADANRTFQFHARLNAT